MKNQDIERLRGIAIFSVLLQHLSITPTIFNIISLKSENLPFYLGVELFFLISGYVVTRSFISKNLNLKLFYVKRVFRILPLIIFFVALTAVLNSFKTIFTVSWNVFASDALAILGSYLINYPNRNVYYNGAMWSLSVEMQFYLVLPIVLVMLSKLKILKSNRMITILFTSYIAIALCFRYIFASGENLKLPGIIYHIAHWRFDFLIIGIMVYFLYIPLGNNLNIKPHKKLLRMIAFLLISINYIFAYNIGDASIRANPSNNILLYIIDNIVFGIVFFGVLKIASRDQNILSIHPVIDSIIEYLGSRSYSLYVLHFPALAIIWMPINKFASFIFYINPIYYGLVQLILFILIGVPMAEIAFRYIERPGMALGEFIINKYKIS